jgi:hypothetical protein
VHPEELITRWQAWDDHPGNKVAAVALSDAAAEYAGEGSLDLYRHVAAARRSGLSIAAAIYTWRDE